MSLPAGVMDELKLEFQLIHDTSDIGECYQML
jgi:hypothetical protein